MRIHVLIENTSCRRDLTAEHGLSLLVEAGGRRILFDTGASTAFAANAERMGIDLRGVDTAVLSHGHYDHGGGLKRFLELNDHASVWVSPHAFEPHFNAAGKDIGLSPELLGHERIRTAPADVWELAPGITLHQAADMPTPYRTANAGMSTLYHGQRVEDDFRHEQYLLVQEQGRRVLFSGCSHRGILNIATHFRPDVLVGGFHLMKTDPVAEAAKLREIADTLLALPTTYYTGHCTGESVAEALTAAMQERLHGFRTGQQILL